MSDIDKAVELAREQLAGCLSTVDCERPACVLARAVLAMAPIITLARMQAQARDSWLTALRAGETAPDDEDAWSCAAHHTESAIRALDAEARRG